MSSESGRYRRPVRPTGTGPAHGTVKMTEGVFIGFSCLVFYLLQHGLLEGEPGRRVVGILEIGPLDHHD